MSFLETKLKNQTARNWDIFYKNNKDNFFKDRHWTDREFPELLQAKTLLEVGCGVGNLVFPLLEKNPELFIHCCDFSPRAVELLKSSSTFQQHRIRPFVCDLTSGLSCDPVDLVTMVFCLSAIPPEKMGAAIQNIANVMKPGALLLFRDYAINDQAQKRFKSSQRLSEKFYYRHDGTFTYFFEETELIQLFESHGLVAEQCEFVERRVENRRQDQVMQRRFIQAKFRNNKVA